VNLCVKFLFVADPATGLCVSSGSADIHKEENSRLLDLLKIVSKGDTSGIRLPAG
jgi:hypothetical protein